jgi:hypothetical protein
VALDVWLVEEARAVLGGESLRAIIEVALREAIKARRGEELLRAIGTMDLAITFEASRALRQDRFQFLDTPDTPEAAS